MATHTHSIKAEAKRLGFFSCGIAQARFLKEEEEKLRDYLNNNLHGEMKYMENHFDKRLNPKLLLENCKSVVSVAMNYFPKQEFATKEGFKFSKYAYGKDYHYVMKAKLNALLAFIKGIFPDANGRAFVDSAPLLERRWAVLSGLGWIGKNGCLIIPKAGSFFVIGELLLDIELDYDSAFDKNYCGSCTRCIDACPTKAIIAPGKIDAKKCLSYFTIEYRGEIPEDIKKLNKEWIFGCDRCQDVCPWNRYSKACSEPDLSPIKFIENLDSIDIKELKKEDFNPTFKNSPVKRTKFAGLIRNIKALFCFENRNSS